MFLSVLNFLPLKKCKGFTNYVIEIQNFERKLNLTHTTLENKLHNQAFDWHPLVFLITPLIPNTVVVHVLYTASEITSIYTEILVQYHSKATDTREEFLYIRTIFNFQAECLIYMLLFLLNFSLSVLNPHVLVCGFLL